MSHPERRPSTTQRERHDGRGGPASASASQWTLSSQLASDFGFERDAARFYQPHDVIQLANGNLMMIDDGTNRPGCSKDITSNCFSRIIECVTPRAARSTAVGPLRVVL